MRLHPFALLLAVLATPGQAAGAPFGPEISPRVRLLGRGLLRPGLGLGMTAAGPGHAELLVQHPGGAGALRDAGFSARLLSDSVAVVTLPAPEIGRLLGLPGLMAVDVTHRLRPLLDRSAPLTLAPAVRRDYGLNGKGVLVAIVDTGIDLRHADFQTVDGKTRILWLLDAAARRAGAHPELPDYQDMAVYSGADIDAVLAAEAARMPPPLTITEQDRSGHGTHVAGIAAGSGRASGNGLPTGRYVGMAPEAGLCVVQASRNGRDFADPDLVTGVRFCLDRAHDAMMPVVVNLSLGGMGGAHDGSSPLERALDELIADRPGRAMIVAAGNSGGDDVHAGGYLLRDEISISVHVSTSAAPISKMSQIGMDLFYDDAATVSLEVRSPKGMSAGEVHAGTSHVGDLGEEGQVSIDNVDNMPAGGRRNAAVVLSGATGRQLATGEWKVILRGSAARYDLWISELSGDLFSRLSGHLDIDTQIEVPASAKQAISVGSFTSRTEWPRLDGMITRRSREELLRASSFTSAGPTADGRFAPDLGAPGEFIASSLSATALPTEGGSVFHVASDADYLWCDDGVHAVLRGTSQAAPHVSGAAALLFQLDPTLTTSRLRELLRTTSQASPGMAGYSSRLGFGKLDVRRAVRRLRGDPPGALDREASSVGVSRDLISPEGGQTTVTVTPRDKSGLPLGPGFAVSIESTAGTFPAAVRDLGSGRYERVLVGAGPRGTLARISVMVAGAELAEHPLVAMVGERSEVGQQARRGSGCGVAGQRGGGPGPGVVLLLGLLLCVGMRRSPGNIRASVTPR